MPAVVEREVSVKGPMVRISPPAVREINDEVGRFRQALDMKTQDPVELKVGSTHGRLSPSFREAFSAFLELFASKSEVLLVALEAELSTQKAADILGVSRPHVVSLIESGVLPARRVGTHRRLKAVDVLVYRDTATRFSERMGKVAAVSAEVGGYDMDWSKSSPTKRAPTSVQARRRRAPTLASRPRGSATAAR